MKSILLAAVLSVMGQPDQQRGNFGLLGAPTVAARALMYDDQFTARYAASIRWPHTIGGKTYRHLNAEDKATLMSWWVDYITENGNPPLPRTHKVHPDKNGRLVVAPNAPTRSAARADVELKPIGVGVKQYINRGGEHFLSKTRPPVPPIQVNRQVGGKQR